MAAIRRQVGPDFIGATAKRPGPGPVPQVAGADYLGVGACFPSPTKPNAKGITREALADICAAVSLPVVAIGGITLQNARQLQGVGMAGLAVISALFAAPDITTAARDLLALSRHLSEGGGAMKTALTIARSDSSGGAGIQADLKTMTLNGVYAMSVLTALTAQNTLGVTGILPVPPAFLVQQMDAVFSDIPPDAVKIGMVASAPLIEAIGSGCGSTAPSTSSWTPLWSPPAAPACWTGAETTLTPSLPLA